MALPFAFSGSRSKVNLCFAMGMFLLRAHEEANAINLQSPTSSSENQVLLYGSLFQDSDSVGFLGARCMTCSSRAFGTRLVSEGARKLGRNDSL